MADINLFMLLLGGKPKGRNTEQHDIFFGIATGMKDLISDIHSFWPECGKNIHIDAWRIVNAVDGYTISIEERTSANKTSGPQLFFLNLGGYKEDSFDELHYKMLLVDESIDNVKLRAKQSAFFKHNDINNHPDHLRASAHIDDKYGVDVDDFYKVEDILPSSTKQRFTIKLSKGHMADDKIHLGYLPIDSIK